MTDLNVFILADGTLEGELFANRITLQCSWKPSFTKAGNDGPYKPQKKTNKNDREQLADPKEIGADATVAAVLTELGGIFRSKEGNGTTLEVFSRFQFN